MRRKKKVININVTKKNDIAIKVSKLFFKYHKDHSYVLQDIDFEINAGEYIAVIGHNGSGKSTLSKLLIGILLPNRGDISIFGNVMTYKTIPLLRKYLGIVFQNPDNQFIGSTVADDIAFGLENQQIETSKMQAIIDKASKRVKMHEYLNHEPMMLSGGQKQRVAIASAIALAADILVFDESTSMLDPIGKDDVKKIILDLKQNEHKTIISITHDMDEILNADKVLVLNKGRVAKFAKPSEVLSDYDFLKSIKLDMPFIFNVIHSLKNAGLEIKETLDEGNLVEQICQLKPKI